MEYEDLDKESFDAIVTGELTHSALWLEVELNNLISDFFKVPQSRVNDFKRLVLLRDGLNFQDKIEISRGIIPLLKNKEHQVELKQVLKEIENFKTWRNAMAHGIDVTEENYDGTIELKITIQIVGRSGKEREITITPESHRKRYDESQKLIVRLENIKKKINRIE